MLWFLIKYHMEFINYPTGTQNITLITEPRGYNRLFAYRDYELKQNDSIIGRITSAWAIIDVETRAIIKPENAIINNDYMTPHTKREDDLDFKKMSPLDNVDITKEFFVRYNDLDINGHANNGNYIIWAFEPLEFDFRTTHKIKVLDIVYKKEALFGDKIVVQIQHKDPLITTIHSVKNSSGEELCSLECIWDAI